MIESNGVIVQKDTWMPGREKKGTEDYRLSSIYSLRAILYPFQGLQQAKLKRLWGERRDVKH